MKILYEIYVLQIFRSKILKQCLFPFIVTQCIYRYINMMYKT